jgi:hypothetical protein
MGEVIVLSAEVPGDWLLSQAPELDRLSQVERGAVTLEHMLTGAFAFVASSRSSATETAGRVERPDVVGVLSQLASGARLFRSGDGRYCAQVPVGDRLEIGVNWFCTTQKFYDKATRAAKGHSGSAWPKSASALGTELRRIAPQLRVHGISIHFERRREGSVVSFSVENGKTGGSNPNITDL